MRIHYIRCRPYKGNLILICPAHFLTSRTIGNSNIGPVVVVYASLPQSEMEEEEEEKKKKTTSARRYSLFKEGLYKAIAEKWLDGYQ